MVASVRECVGERRRVQHPIRQSLQLLGAHGLQPRGAARVERAEAPFELAAQHRSLAPDLKVSLPAPRVKHTVVGRRLGERFRHSRLGRGGLECIAARR